MEMMDVLDNMVHNLRPTLPPHFQVATSVEPPRIVISVLTATVPLERIGLEALVPKNTRSEHYQVVIRTLADYGIMRTIHAQVTREGWRGYIKQTVYLAGTSEDWADWSGRLTYRLVTILTPPTERAPTLLSFSAQTTNIRRSIPTVTATGARDLKTLLERVWLVDNLRSTNYQGTVVYTPDGWLVRYQLVLAAICLKGRTSGLNASVLGVLEEADTRSALIRRRLDELPTQINSLASASMGKIDQRSTATARLLPSVQRTTVDGLVQYTLYYYLRITMKLSFWPSEHLLVE